MKFICPICGYVAEGSRPNACPQCGTPGDKFTEAAENKADYATVHAVGIAKSCTDEMILEGLKAHFMGECTEVGMYLAMSRQADREGYPEVAEAYKRIAFEEAEHAAKFAEMLGEVVTDSTKKNLEMRAEAEHGACQAKVDIALRAKELGFDDIYNSVNEMAKDEARHGSAFKGLIKRI